MLYHSYLQLDKILGAQELMSARRPGSEGFGPKGGAPDEHLFIVIHQTYEFGSSRFCTSSKTFSESLGRNPYPKSRWAPSCAA